MASSRRSHPGVLMLSAALLAAVLAGCSKGSAVGEVSGQVTFQKKPVTEGTITFVNPTTGYAAEANLGGDGRYVVQTKEGGLVVGEYVVMVKPPIYLDGSDPKTPPAPTEKPAPNIPEQYRGPRTPLRAKVQEGINTLHFEMTR